MRRIGGSESYFPSCNVQTKGWQHDENKYIHLWHISSNTPNAYQEHSWRCTLTWVRRSLHEIPSKTIVCCSLIILKNYVHNLHNIEFSDYLIWHDTHKALLKSQNYKEKIIDSPIPLYDMIFINIYPPNIYPTWCYERVILYSTTSQLDSNEISVFMSTFWNNYY